MNNVTQADRDAAIVYWGNDNPPLELTRAMCAHRIASCAAKDAEIAALQSERDALKQRVAYAEGIARVFDEGIIELKQRDLTEIEASIVRLFLSVRDALLKDTTP